MDPIVPATPAAPAQPVAPSTVSAADAAVASGDTGTYREARRMERIGKPLAAVAVADPAPTPVADDVTTDPPAVPAQPAQPQLSKRQQGINDRAQRAVESATASLREENERLKAQLAAPNRQPAAPATPPAPAQPTEPEWKRLAAMPDYPKLADFESVEEHAAAVGLFIHDQREKAAQQRSESDQQDETHMRRITAFDTRVNALVADDPEIVSKIQPRAQTLSRRGGPFHAIADLVLDSEHGPVLLRDHYDALEALGTLPESMRSLPLQQQIRAHLQHVMKEFGKLEGSLAIPAAPTTPAPKTLTDADEAPQTLGSRAAEATDPMVGAIKRNDTGAYRRLRREQRAAAIRR